MIILIRIVQLLIYNASKIISSLSKYKIVRIYDNINSCLLKVCISVIANSPSEIRNNNLVVHSVLAAFVISDIHYRCQDHGTTITSVITFTVFASSLYTISTCIIERYFINTLIERFLSFKKYTLRQRNGSFQ